MIRRRSVKFDESPQVVRYSYNSNGSFQLQQPARFSSSTASLGYENSSLQSMPSYSSDYNIAKDSLMDENADELNDSPEEMVAIFRRKDVPMKRQPLRTVYESQDDIEAFHHRQRSSSFDGIIKNAQQLEQDSSTPKTRVNLRSNANALRTRRNNPFVRHSVAEIVHRPSGVTRVLIGDYEEQRPMYETEEMALHVTECMNLLQTSCDKILGARQLIENDGAIPAGDRDKLMRMVTKSILQVHTRLEGAIPLDARLSDISSNNEGKSGSVGSGNTMRVSIPTNITASSVQTPEMSREMLTQLMPQFFQLLQENMQKRN
uniref:Uncharacterized protein n=1 Tax=Acrobeloides nanus TaxID=290746 RepID=A0A914C1P8_9BILA